MDESKMKNIIVLKDLPSNIVDEAIVILKNKGNVKDKQKIENKNMSNCNEIKSGNYELAVKEAEIIIQNYIKEMEKPKEDKRELKKINIKYKKLQISSFFLGIVAIIGVILSIFK